MRRYNLKNRSDDNNNNSNDDSSSNNNGGIKCDGGGSEGDASRPRPPPQLRIHCLDFAPAAVRLLREDPRFVQAAEEGRVTAHVYDLSTTHPSAVVVDPATVTGGTRHSGVSPRGGKPEVLANSADVAVLLFCLSAVGPHPSPPLERAARHVVDILKPGGTLVLRDYGRLNKGERDFSSRVLEAKQCNVL